MLAYAARRILATIPVMLVVAFFVFSLLYLAPGDPAAIIAGDQASPAGRGAHPRLARPGPAVPGALRRMAVADHARRPRHLDLHQPAGQPHDRATHRTHAVADGADHRVFHRGGDPAWRAGGMEARLLDRPRRDDAGGVRLLRAGVRGRLHAGLCVRAAARLAAGAGLHPDQRRAVAVPAPHDPAHCRAGPGLRGAARAHHARDDAGSAEPGLCAHRQGKGCRISAPCCSCTR